MRSAPLPDFMEPFDAELTVIGAAFLDPSSVVRSGCTVEDFAFITHRTTWGVIQALVTEGAPVDCATVQTRLEARGALELAGGPEGVSGMADGAASAMNVEHHGGIVRQAAKARRAYRLVESMSAAVMRELRDSAGEGRLEAGIRRAMSTVASEAIAAMSDVGASYEWVTMRAAKREALERIYSRHQAWAAGQRPEGLLPTGLEQLDSDTGGGLEMGHLCSVDGASGAGKTAYLVNQTRAVARHLHSIDPDPAVSGVVAYYSCEVPGSDLATRDISAQAGVNSMDVRSGRLHTDGAIDRLFEFGKATPGDDHIYIGFRPSASIEWITAEVQLIEATVGPVRMVVIDHWNEVTTTKRGLRSDEREAAHIAAQMDGLKAPTQANPLGRLVVAGAQYTADGSRMLWGNTLKHKVSYSFSWLVPGKGLDDDAPNAIIRRNKMRNGPVGDTPVKWTPTTGRIEDVRR